MRHQLVTGSSNVFSFGYDPRMQVLEVTFLDKSTYQYFGVNENIFRGMQAAPSKGKYIAQFLRGRYRYKRLPELEGR